MTPRLTRSGVVAVLGLVLTAGIFAAAPDEPPTSDVTGVARAPRRIIRQQPAPSFWPMHGQNGRRAGQVGVPGAISPILKWQYNFGLNQFDRAIRAQDNGGPIVGPDGVVYQVTTDGLFAIRPDGTRKWRVNLGELSSMPVRAAAALSPDATRIYVCDISGGVFARSTADGATIWSFELPSNQDVSYSSPAVDDDGILYFGARMPASVYAFDPSGSIKWIYTHPNSEHLGIEAPVAIGPEGNVYCIVNTVGLVALDLNGQFKWSKGDNCGSYGWPTPAVLPDGTVIVPGDPSYPRLLVAYNPDGSTKWSRNDIGASGGYFAGAAVSKGGEVVYVTRLGGKVYALDAQQGTTHWSNTVTTSEELSGSPVLAGNGILYVMGAGDHVYAVNDANGAVLWQYQLNSPAFFWGPQSPAMGPDGTLYVVSSGTVFASGNVPGRLFAFNPSTAP